ncbi:MAG: zf-HC2 domain-containing protein [Pseudomonadales bacterium]
MNQHAKCQELIPWYVNDSLDATELSKLQPHLERCADCRQQIEEAKAIVQSMEDDQAFHEKLEQLACRQDESFDKLSQHLVAPRHRRFLPLLTTTAVVLCAVALALTIGLRPQSTTFESMTRDASTESPIVQVLFSPGFTEAELRQFLEDSQGRLLGSPSAKGMYRIALPVGQDAAEYASRVRKHPGVRWAESEQ